MGPRQSEGEGYSFGPARRAQARVCLSTRARLTVIFLTFSVLAQGGISTSSVRQLLGAADTQTAHHATFSTVPTRRLLGSANAETTPARAPAAAADRK